MLYKEKMGVPIKGKAYPKFRAAAWGRRTGGSRDEYGVLFTDREITRISAGSSRLPVVSVQYTLAKEANFISDEALMRWASPYLVEEALQQCGIEVRPRTIKFR